jgi:dipeptidyl aminopeptidase/acylaminoacyl peptidase
MLNRTKEMLITDDQSVLARYQRAELLDQEVFNQSIVLNTQIVPHWIGDSNCFWYTRQQRKKDSTDIATEYRLVDAGTATQTEAFNTVLLAQALAKATGKNVNPDNLPISELRLELVPTSVFFTAFDKHWRFDTAQNTCKTIASDTDSHSIGAGWLCSPDGKKAAFSRDYNLWIRDINSGEERALTQNGKCNYAYGVEPQARDLIKGLKGGEPSVPPLEALWSPDSSLLFTFQLDERPVRSLPSMLYVPQDGTVAPKVIERKNALSGDKHIAQYRMVVIDVATAKETAANYPALDDSVLWLCPFSGNRAWWAGDSKRAYFVDVTRGQKTARLMAFNIQTGAVECLFEESSDTYLELGLEFEHPSMLRLFAETNELIWYSERSGWAHLYLYDLATGELKNTITSGDWRVRDLVQVDKIKREVWLQIAGRVEDSNPYYRELVRVNIDSSEMVVLASGDYDYSLSKQPGCNAGLSPTHQFLVINQSRVDMPSVTELRDRNGKTILTLETADTTGLPQGWQWPERVTLKADDGTTDIYALVFRPSDFDVSQTYPILDFDTVIPSYANYPTAAFHMSDPGGNYWYTVAASMAELGFIVTLIMGRGTPYRSKKFHDFGYESFIAGAGIIDHVAGIKQLAERYSYMDLTRVGIMKSDAPGNGAVFGLLNHPDFYKVGVAFSIWDPRLVKQGEVYHGLIDESDCQQPVWRDAVQQLQGKLLLVTGMLDSFFHSSMTFQLVDAVGKANKDIDLLIQPNGGHGWRVKNAQRRAWDYLVRHLQGSEPPKDFKLQSGLEKIVPQMMQENDL